jgi:hypothetical protein
MLLLPKLTMSMHTWRKKEKKEKEKKQIASSKAQSINRFPALLCFQVIIVEK